MGLFKTKHHSAADGFLHRKLGPTLGSITLFTLEVLQIVIISAAIIFPIRYFLIKPFYVKGASMEPNFYDHEYLVIDELTYRFREPMRGEIVVFRYPNDRSQFFIKRVVALPGETVEITDGNVVIYNDAHPNGIIAEENYLVETTEGKQKTTLSPGEFFVLGDNRNESLDSRFFGPVMKNEIIGRVWVRGLPISRATTFDLPEYNF